MYMLFNLFKCVRNAHVSPHAARRTIKSKWRKCNFISIQFEMWTFFRPFSMQSLFLYHLLPLCLPSSKLKPLKLKAYFIPFRSFSFGLFFIQRAAAAIASNTHATTPSSFRWEIVTNNGNDFIQHVTRIVRISNDRWPQAARTRVVFAYGPWIETDKCSGFFLPKKVHWPNSQQGQILFTTVL